MPLINYATYRPVSLREIRPEGWLRAYLLRQCEGLTAHPEASGYPYGNRFWGSWDPKSHHDIDVWWPYEQIGYWIEGALKCGYLVGDQQVYQSALQEVDDAVSHAATDGFIGPDFLREKDRWPYAVFFRAVLAQYEISGDRSYIEALVRHYKSLPQPLGWDRDVTGVEILVLLHWITGDEELLEMAEDLYRRFNIKFPEHDCSLQSMTSGKRATEHGVSYNEIGKLAAILFCANGQEAYLQAVKNGFAKLDRDQLLADGMHSCTEQLRGKGELDSHETCDITDHTWALSYLLQATGDTSYADRIEKIMFNAAPGAITKDFRALQYFSCPNQVVVGNNTNHNHFMGGENWMMYRADHEIQCCPGNAHRAMPNFAHRMWLRAPDDTPSGGIVAAMYGPGTISTRAGMQDHPITIRSETNYPFEQGVNFQLETEQPNAFGWVLRIPGWCSEPAIWVNDQAVHQPLPPGSFIRIDRQWQDGDRIRLSLPFHISLEHWPNGGISLNYGPFTLSLPVQAQAEVETENSTELQRRKALRETYVAPSRPLPEGFPAWNLFPISRWNYALCLNEDNLQKSIQVTWHPSIGYPFDPESIPFSIRVPARKVRGWRVSRRESIYRFTHWFEDGELQRGDRRARGNFLFTPPLPNPAQLAARLSKSVEWIDLVPYGSTLLRMTVFPQGYI